MFENDVVEIDDEEVNELDDGLNADTPDDTGASENDDESVKQKTDKYTEQEKEDFHGRVQKRINKLTYEVKSRDSKLEENSKYINELETRLSQIESRISQADKANQDNEVNGKIAQLKRQKIELMETGQFDEAADIDDQIIELKVNSRQSPKVKEPDKPTPAPRQTAPEPEPVPEAHQAWLDANDWFYNPRKAEQRNKACATYEALVGEGYDPEEPELYAELDKRLNTKRTAAPPPAGVDRGNAVTGNGQVKFTAADKEKMLNWGLNPNDPEARKEYLKNKVGA